MQKRWLIVLVLQPSKLNGRNSMKAEVRYVIGKSGIKCYHYRISSIGCGSLDQEGYEAIRDAFNNPIISVNEQNNETV